MTADLEPRGCRVTRFIAVSMALAISACASTTTKSSDSSPTATVELHGSERRHDAKSGSPIVGTNSAGAERRTTGSSGSPKQAGGAPLPASGGSRGPIKVGLLYAINDAAESAGVDNGNTFTPSDVVRAFVRSYNATGGIGGRRIDPVYADLRSTSHDYESQMQAVCASFTQDNRVAAVLSNFGYYSETLLSCLARAEIPIISGDWVAPDRYAAERFPLFVTPNTLLGETRVGVVVKHLTRTSFLQPRHRVGVVIEGCPVDQRIYKNGLAPALQRAGLKVASTYETRCFQAIQDYAEQTSQMSSAVLRFRQQNVDRVIVVSQGAEANLLFAFSTVAEQQGWHPGYALSSIALPEALALNAPEGQLVNMRGVGWLPMLDSHDRKQAPPTATARRCLERMKGQGVQPSSNTDYAYVYVSCDSFVLYDAALRTANGDARPSAVMSALNRVATSYVSAFTVDGRVVVSAGRIRPGAGRLFAYAADRGFAYTSAAFPL